MKLSKIDQSIGSNSDNPSNEAIEEIGITVLGLLPISGNVISAKEAYESYRAAQIAVENGDYSDAGIEAAFAVLGVVGAVPAVGFVARVIAKALRKGGKLIKLVKRKNKATKNSKNKNEQGQDQDVSKSEIVKKAEKEFDGDSRGLFEKAKKVGTHIRDKFLKDNAKKIRNGTGRILGPEIKPPSSDQVARAFKNALGSLNEERKKQGFKPETKAQFTPEDIAPGLDQINAIEGFVRSWLDGGLPSNGQNTAELNLGRVGDNFSKRVLKETGMDVANLDRVIDTFGLKHAWDGHGPKGELGAMQEPLSPESISIYKDAVENFDRIDVRKKKNADTITFEKDINGTIVVVEEVRTGKGQLAFKTMWIEKRK